MRNIRRKRRAGKREETKRKRLRVRDTVCIERPSGPRYKRRVV